MYVRVSSQATLRLVEVNDDPVGIAGVVAAKDYLALDGLMRAAGSPRGVHGSAVSNSGVRRTLRMRWSPTCSTSPARATSACS